MSVSFIPISHYFYSIRRSHQAGQIQEAGIELTSWQEGLLKLCGFGVGHMRAERTEQHLPAVPLGLELDLDGNTVCLW